MTRSGTVVTEQLTAVSLFAGVGGFDIAFDRNGVEVVAAVEIDDAAPGVLAHRFPTTTLFTDVCEVTGDELRAAGFIPEHGILVGGFPCQDLSVAGKRAGLAGRRSGLFWEICRLLDETKPKWFILENVPGLLSSQSGRDMGAVIGALVERGYGISWRVLDAQHFGVPQRRRRVFIVGCLGDDGSAPFEVLAIREGRERYLEASQSKGKDAAGKSPAGVGDSRATVIAVEQPQLFEADRRDGIRLHDDVVPTLQSFMGTGGNNVPMVQQPAVLMRQREGKEGGGKSPLLSVEKSLTIATSNDQVLFPPAVFPIQNTVIGRSDTAGPNGPGFAEDGSPMFTLDTVGGHGVAAVYPIQDGRELDKQQNGLGVGDEGDPAYTLDRVSQQAVAFVKAGRAQSAEDAETWREDSIAPTVNTFDVGDSRATVLPVQSSVVRRLTPTECERLQGFPDGWTAQRWDYKKQQVIDQPDSARYKQMGNAVAVPVVSWIVSRIVAWESGEL